MKRQPVLYGSAAVVALWSAWIVMHGRNEQPLPAALAHPAPLLPMSRAPAAAAPASAAAASQAAASTSAAGGTSGVEAARLAVAADQDTFAARQWFTPPPPPPPPAPPPVTPPAPPPPPPPPTLPYRFVGLLDEGGGAKPRVFLSLGEKLIVAGVGDVVEGGYRLVAISGQELVFQHLQNNVTLRLAVAQGSS